MYELSVGSAKQPSGRFGQPTRSPTESSTERSRTLSPMATPHRGPRPRAGTEKIPYGKFLIEKSPSGPAAQQESVEAMMKSLAKDCKKMTKC